MVGSYGYFSSGGTGHGFVYNGSTFTTLDHPLGVHGTTAAGISGSNIVGTYITSTKNYGFVYNGTTFTTLDDPQETQGTQPNDIDGTNIVGTYYDAAGGHGFFYNGSTYTSLDNPLGMYSTMANGISGNKVVGYYTDSSGTTHGFLSAVPKPGDYNENGIVDVADYVLWRKNPGAFGGDPGGYNIWRANFGQTPGSGATLASAGSSSAVPEPTTDQLLLFATVAFRRWNRFRRNHC
jgi:hypothetical protein